MKKKTDQHSVGTFILRVLLLFWTAPAHAASDWSFDLLPEVK